MKPSLKKWGWLLVALVVLVAVLIKLSGRQPVARVSVVTVARENLNATVLSNGKVEAIGPYAIRSRFYGFVDKVFAVEGQTVKKGQLLLTMGADDMRADLARAREQLLSAEDDLRAARAGGRADEAAQIESDLKKATLERDRLLREREALERLVVKQAATREELAQNQVQLARAEAEWQQAQKKQEEFKRRAALNVQRAQLLAERYRNEVLLLEERVRSADVSAPVDGTLYSLPVHPRDYLGTGALLAELADLRRVRVRAFIDEPELGVIEPGQMMDITWDGLPNEVWHGRTEQVPRQVVARGTRSVGEVLCSVENPKGELLPNINVNVRVHVQERRNALVVPRGAVQMEGTHRVVYVLAESRLGVDNSRLQKRNIKLGIGSATNFEVLEGLSEGEKVALPSDVVLRDGLTVRVAETK